MTLNSSSPAVARIVFEPHAPAVAFAVQELGAALKARGYELEHGSFEPSPAPASAPELRIFFLLREQARQHGVPDSVGAAEWSALRAEGFALGVERAAGVHTLWVIGADVAGELYGGLELAEQIRAFGVEGVTPLARSPH